MSNAFSYKNSKGVTYYLHAKQVQLKSGSVRTIYFFGKTIKTGAIVAVPVGYRVKEARNGLPVLAKAI